jgi:hypothetical protein
MRLPVCLCVYDMINSFLNKTIRFVTYSWTC